MKNQMESCRACKSKNMSLFFPFGDHPPANQFLSEKELDVPEPLFPLNAYVCLDCALIQVPDKVPPGFFKHYVYMPSASSTMHTHFAHFAQKASSYCTAKTDRIVDIGCNDGLFLKACKDLGYPVLGIDPADNITELARKKGIEVVGEYFNSETARNVVSRYSTAQIIVTTNTFNHIDNLHNFMEGVLVLLNDQGVFIVEVPHSLNLVVKNEFDTIYHEHLSEFSVKSFMDLYRHFDMEIFDIERLPVHGGSMRIFAQKKNGPHKIKPAVDKWLADERDAELFSKSTYAEFKQRIDDIGKRLVALLKKLKSEGKSIAGYGAPAKGNTLLNYYRIGPDLLDFLADKNSLKQGLYSPGMHIPVVHPDIILKKKPDYLLILAWNFADEIIEQQSEYGKGGGRFIVPIPDIAIISQ